MTSDPSHAAIRTGDAGAFASWAARRPPADVAEALDPRTPADRERLFDAVAPERQPAVFRHFRCETQADLVRRLERDTARRLLEALDADDRTRFFEALSSNERDSMLGLLGPDGRRQTIEMLTYPPDSVGRLMSPAFAAISEHWHVEDAIGYLRSLPLEPETLATVYVTDSGGRLVDALDLPRIALADPAALVRDIMDGVYVSITPLEDREQAVRLMQKHDLIALPVVDTAGVLVGVVTVDDVLQVAEEETTEDIHRQAGMEPLRATYPDVATRSLVRKRLPWLAALIFVYLGASAVISAFEEALAAQLALAAFIPLLMGSGGNVGAQSGTLIVRALAVGDLEHGRSLHALRKELGVGLVLGAALGGLAAAVAFARGGGEIALVVGTSMFLIVIAANLTGTLLPVLLARTGIDPAVAASPVITSVTDLTSLVLYLGIASRLLAL